MGTRDWLGGSLARAAPLHRILWALRKSEVMCFPAPPSGQGWRDVRISWSLGLVGCQHPGTAALPWAQCTPQRAGPDDRLRGDFARLKRERSSTLHTMAGSGRLGGRSLLLLLLVGFVKITIVRASVPALLRICLPGLVRPKRSPNPEKI
jgi:hypothetical protein